jgi:TatA/E family protein of Tat protein translocase
MSRLGLPELIIIFLAIVFLFGAKALPGIARGLAEAIKNFKKNLKEPDSDLGNKEDAGKKNSA